MATTAQFTVGDRVNFAWIRYNGNSIQMTTKEGKLLKISGDECLIKSKGRIFKVHHSEVRPIRSRSAIGDMMAKAIEEGTQP